MVGSTVRSIRSITPAASSRRKRSGSDAATTAASKMSPTMPVNSAGSGCTTARLSIHGSRGRTQQMRSGSTPLPSSQMQASVAVLPEPTTTYWDGARVDRHQLVDRDDAGRVRHGERRWRGRGDLRLPVARVDHPSGSVIAGGVLGAELEAHSAGGEQPLHHSVVVGTDLRRGGALVETRLRSLCLQAAGAELRRRDAVEDRGLVQPHERVRVPPVATGRFPPVDDRHVHVVGVVNQGVHERQARGTGADDDVVAVRHGRTLLLVSRGRWPCGSRRRCRP